MKKEEYLKKLSKIMKERHRNGFKPRLGTGKGVIKNGYRYIFISKGKLKREHRLIWEKQKGEIPFGYDIHHKNSNRLDNRIENLYIIKHGEYTSYHNTQRNKLNRRIF